LKSLEHVINQLLCRDQDVLDDMAGLSGRVVRIEFINTRLILNLLLTDHGIQIDYADARQADVLIKGTPINILLYAISTRSGNTHISGEVEIAGDAGLAQKFQRLMQRIDVDWEEQLSRITGDTLSRKTSNSIMAGVGFLRQLKRKIAMDISEYALYEKEVLPDKDEIDDFNRSVDVLRNDLERMKQRIKKLEPGLSA